MSGGPRPVTPVTIAAGIVSSCAERLAGDPPDAGTVAALRADLGRAADLLAGLDEHCGAGTEPASGALTALARHTAEVDWSRHPGPQPLEQEMLSGHVEGALLGLLVSLTGARRVLEVGMFTGYSALAMAEALPEDGEVVACELDPAVAEVARTGFARSAAGDRIRVEVGPAAATLARLAEEGERFDLVFVDADKEGYGGYVDTLLDTGLLRVGGLLCLDNMLLQGEPWGPAPSAAGAHLAALSARLVADPRTRPVLLPVRDGITLARREPA